MKRVYYLSLTLLALGCSLVTCRQKTEADIVPKAPFNLLSVTEEDFSGLTELQWKAALTDFSTLTKPSSRFSTTYAKGGTGQVTSQTLTYSSNAEPRTYKYSHSTNRILRTYIAYNRQTVSDTIHLDQQGHVTEVSLYWDYKVYRRFLYNYDASGQVQSERHYNVIGCNGINIQYDLSHQIANGNRLHTKAYYRQGWYKQAIDSARAEATLYHTYEYDLTRPNPGISYDIYNQSSYCSGIVDPVLFYPGLDNGMSRNLLSKVTVEIKTQDNFPPVVKNYSYYYEYDKNNRIKTLYISVSYPNRTVGYAIYKRSFRYVDE